MNDLNFLSSPWIDGIYKGSVGDFMRKLVSRVETLASHEVTEDEGGWIRRGLTVFAHNVSNGNRMVKVKLPSGKWLLCVEAPESMAIKIESAIKSYVVETL